MCLTVCDDWPSEYKSVYANGRYIGVCECRHNVLSFTPCWDCRVRVMAVGVSELRYKILKLYDFNENQILNLARECEENMKRGETF